MWLFQIFFCYQFLVLFHYGSKHTCYDPYCFKFVVLCPDYGPRWWIFHVHLAILCISVYFLISHVYLTVGSWELFPVFCVWVWWVWRKIQKAKKLLILPISAVHKGLPHPHFPYLVFINLSTTRGDNSLHLRTESLVIYLPSLFNTGTCKIYFKSKFTAYPVIKLTNKHLLQHKIHMITNDYEDTKYYQFVYSWKPYICL